MPDNIPLRHYVGENHAHKVFVEKYRFLNALYYLVVSNKQVLEENFQKACQPPAKVVGVVTHPISNTQFQGVFVPTQDAFEMAEDFDGFVKIFNHQTICTSYLYYVDFCMDLLEEITSSGDVAISEKMSIRLQERFMSLDHVKKIYIDELGINLYSEPSDEMRLNYLLATRNTIEHADCRVNREYLRLTGSNLALGDLIPASSKEVGESLALVEHLAMHLNKSCESLL